MKFENFSDANKQLIKHKTLFNKVVKSSDSFDVENSFLSKKIINNKSVLLICDYEGSIVFIDEVLGKNICRQSIVNKSILDYLHQEDVPNVIEQLVHLLQEKSHDILINTRFLSFENKNIFIKWHVGYLRGLFYFYPIELPKLILNNLTFQDSNSQNLNSKTSVFPEHLMWKMEVYKTLCEWDVFILKQIKFCTTF